MSLVFRSIHSTRRFADALIFRPRQGLGISVAMVISDL